MNGGEEVAKAAGRLEALDFTNGGPLAEHHVGSQRQRDASKLSTPNSLVTRRGNRVSQRQRDASKLSTWRPRGKRPRGWRVAKAAGRLEALDS